MRADATFKVPSAASRGSSLLTIFLITIGLVALAIAIFLFSLSFNRPYIAVDLVQRGESWVVQAVDFGGLANAAGIEPGDIVITVDGQAPEQFMELRRYARSGAIREVEVIDREGTLTAVSVDKSSLPREGLYEPCALFATGLIYWVVGGFVYYKRPYKESALRLYLLSLVIVLALVAEPAGSRGISGAPEIQVLAFAFIPPLFLHFLLVFPDEKQRPLRGLGLRYAIYLPAVFLSLSYFLWGGNESVWYGWIRPLILLHLALGLTFGAAGLIYSYVRARSGLTKGRIKIVIASVVAAVCPVIFLVILPEVVIGRVLVLPQFAVLSTILVPIALGYSIVRYRLLDIDFYLNRALVYGLCNHR